MIIKRKNIAPNIHKSVYIAANATICGDVKIGKNSCILFGASIIAEGSKIEIGENCIILENVVIRSSEKHSTKLNNNILIGPHAHIVGCTIEDDVFVATGASIFHGAYIGTRSEIRINGVVHIKTKIPKDTTIPINWIAVGDPVKILPPNEHETIWSYQKTLNFPRYVYDVKRSIKGKSNMKEICERYYNLFRKHINDEIIC